MALVEKQIKSIMNKMTKEKFDKLSGQMCDIPITSYEALTLVIRMVYEKAVGEPVFADMYAKLCYRLSERVKNSPFVKIIESDEDPEAEAGAEYNEDEDSGCTTYRWSNDVSITDAEIIGPFDTEEECIDVATDKTKETSPIKRGETELSLHRLLIKRGRFIKIMLCEETSKFYTVFFPVAKAEQCGQQLTTKIFTSEIECQGDASKKNTFKRSLLNKCEDEFNKQDIYQVLKDDMRAYNKAKSTFSAPDAKQKAADLEFRRIKIKKQMLGNIKFIGELYKLSMLKEKIMRFCIQSLMKLEEVDGAYLQFRDVEDDDMDEEDHEALCQLFTTIGKTIDTRKAQPFMSVYFKKIETMSDDKDLSSRSRFMYKDLIEMRSKGWKFRREMETAKTLDEIRKDAERDERNAAQQSAQGGGYGGGRGGGGRGGGGRGGGGGYQNNQGGRGGGDYRNQGGRGGGGGDYRSDNRRENQGDARGAGYGGSQKPAGGRGGFGSSSGRGGGPAPGASSRAPPVPTKILAAPKSGGPGSKAAFSPDKLKNRAKGMRNEFMADKNEKELLLSMDDLSGTPDAGRSVVQINLDDAFEAKENERRASIAMVVVLYKSNKLSKSDIEAPMADIIEFIDSLVVDAPGAFNYLGDMLTAFFEIKALSPSWLYASTNKCEKASDKAKVISTFFKSMKAKLGGGAVKALFGESGARQSLEKLLGSDYSSIASEYLSL